MIGQGAVLGALAFGVALLWARRRLVVVTIEGASMMPTLRDGDRVLVRRRPLGRIRNGDIVVLEPPRDGEYVPAGPSGLDGPAWNVKRVVALPGDRVPPEVNGDGRVPDGALAVLGDNRSGSVDSRHYGHLTADRLLGVVVRRLTRR